MIEIGIDSFAAVPQDKGVSNAQAIKELIERMVYADEVGLDYFGLGEHHRREFLDSASHMILAAAASRTKKIKLGSAVSIISSADPVRVFQNFATLDLISNGRAEIVAGRGSFIESFPLFGYNLNEYDAIFAEKLELLLKIRDNEQVNWEGKYRSKLIGQTIYPRPVQKKLPIHIGVGGTPASFVRAGKLGLPLMVAVIGGETHRFRPLIDSYKEAGIKAGHDLEDLKVGLHSLGFVAETKEKAVQSYYSGYEAMFTKIGKERGFPPVTRERFDLQNGPTGALLVAHPEEVAEKIIRHSEALGGITRFTFQMDAGLKHAQLLESIRLIGEKVKPLVNRP